jgi:hypothetical protein
VRGRPGRFYPQKLLLLVRAGARATLVVPKRERARYALLYDRSKWSIPYRRGYRIADGDSAVTFRACRSQHPNFAGEGVVGAWTEFNGAALVAGARCVALDVYRPGEAKPLRRFLAFGTQSGACPPS